MPMDILLGKTLEELQAVAQEVGLPRFAGKQLAEWLYVRRATSFDEMTNISLKGREALKARYTIGRHAPVAEAISKDGTKKYLFAIDGDEARGDEAIRREARYIESVYIPDDDRATICVSTQAGCKMGCRFCMTCTLGLHGHLSAADIINQSGGICCLAHPGRYDSLELAWDLAEAGKIQAIELSHPANSESDREEIEKIIKKYWLVPLGGTDYHGYYSSHPHPLGTCTTPGEALDALMKVREELNK